MNGCELKPISIGELSEQSFEVPSYQRGYRWKERQVKDLLDDIAEFAESKKGDETYCLQPLVVKKKEDKWEVIDGQQRLTTIYIILSYLEQDKLFTIEYDTRTQSNGHLKEIQNPTEKKINIDGFYFNQAHDTIVKWFKNKPKEDKDKWLAELLKAQFIWYKTKDEDENDDNKKTIEVFRRLNSGKIPLTDSELIRALFIIDAKDKNNPELGFMRQCQIGSEWDYIEQQLHNDDFWAFITLNNPFPKNEYPNRIEYIFDLIEQKEKGTAKIDDKYSTFRMYNDWVNAKDGNKKSATELWKEIKKYYYRFHEWYIDVNLYNLIGYALTAEIKECNLQELLDFADNNKQSEIEKYIKSKIRRYVFGDNIESTINEVRFGDNRIGKILLLFNISTLRLLKKPEKNKKLPKFDFVSYKKLDWDIEHIRSQTPESNKDKWLEDVLRYMGNPNNKETKNTKLIDKIKKYLKHEEQETDEKIFSEVQAFFGESEENYDTNGIGNLTLLDSGTNRGYKNAVFPIKREYIIANIKAGEIFVPVCTQNVFLKFYSENISNMFEWTVDDCDNYRNEIKRTITSFFNQGEE